MLQHEQASGPNNFDGELFTSNTGGRPDISFSWREVNGKRRLIGNPNRPMRAVHQSFQDYLRRLVDSIGAEALTLKRMFSASGCIKGSNPTLNAKRHQALSQGIAPQFFYVTDLAEAYRSLNVERLAVLILYLEGYQDLKDLISIKGLSYMSEEQEEFLKSSRRFQELFAFLKVNFAGLHGAGLAVGGPASPYLLNLYCEAFLDSRLRNLCDKYNMKYSRYVDDMVFSREIPVNGDVRREIRDAVQHAGFRVNRRKTKVLCVGMGSVWVTGVGLTSSQGSHLLRITFSQKSRRKLHGMIGSYLKGQFDNPEFISGHVAQFIYYFNQVEPTATDLKTFRLCKEFEADWAKHRR